MKSTFREVNASNSIWSDSIQLWLAEKKVIPVTHSTIGYVSNHKLNKMPPSHRENQMYLACLGFFTHFNHDASYSAIFTMSTILSLKGKSTSQHSKVRK